MVIPPESTTVLRYIELALRLAKWDADLVDSYYGPIAVAQDVAIEELRKPADLLADADHLLADVEDPWLAAQVRALRVAAARMAGSEPPYLELVEQTYGFRPRWFDEADFELAHRLLDESLPGRRVDRFSPRSVGRSDDHSLFSD